MGSVLGRLGSAQGPLDRHQPSCQSCRIVNWQGVPVDHHFLVVVPFEIAARPNYSRNKAAVFAYFVATAQYVDFDDY